MLIEDCLDLSNNWFLETRFKRLSYLYSAKEHSDVRSAQNAAIGTLELQMEVTDATTHPGTVAEPALLKPQAAACAHRMSTLRPTPRPAHRHFDRRASVAQLRGLARVRPPFPGRARRNASPSPSESYAHRRRPRPSIPLTITPSLRAAARPTPRRHTRAYAYAAAARRGRERLSARAAGANFWS